MTAEEVAARVAAVLAEHRVNYHHRNVGPEPVTSDNMRYTSCDGCGWLGGFRDEAGWEAHVVAELADAGLLAVSMSELTEADLHDVGQIINPGAGMSVNPDGYSADVLRGILARHAAAAAALGAGQGQPDQTVETLESVIASLQARLDAVRAIVDDGDSILTREALNTALNGYGTSGGWSEAAGLRAAVEALAEGRADGKDIVRLTQAPIPGVGIGEVTSTFVRQDALRAALTPEPDESGA